MGNKTVSLEDAASRLNRFDCQLGHVAVEDLSVHAIVFADQRDGGECRLGILVTRRIQLK